MRFSGEAVLLRIFIGESDRFDGKSLYQALVERFRHEGLAGTTVVRGIEGFGASSHLHTSRILRLSEDLPIVVEAVDTAENIERIMPIVDAMIGDGLVTLEKVNVVTYRSAGPGSSPAVIERLRLLEAEASAIEPGPGRMTALAGSLRAAREYGASDAQLAEATGLSVDEVRRALDS